MRGERLSLFTSSLYRRLCMLVSFFFFVFPNGIWQCMHVASSATCTQLQILYCCCVWSLIRFSYGFFLFIHLFVSLMIRFQRKYDYNALKVLTASISVFLSMYVHQSIHTRLDKAPTDTKCNEYK